jgi:WD40 repeat protein
MARDGDCPSPETLVAFLSGELEPEQSDAVNRHIDVCAECEARAQQVEQDADPLVAALRQPTPSIRPPSSVPAGRPAEPSASGDEPFHLDGYRILGPIGRGGMGVVYLVFQHRLNRMVAVKMILAGQLAGAEERVRFRMEGTLLARLSHPNFVQVHEVGTVEVGDETAQPYLVLEYIDGGSLKARLAERPLSFREAAQSALVLARAMAAAHTQGVIHRDLKPANVLIARDGTLKITDFGLAKEMDTRASLTASGQALGTPSYMAPEQAKAHAHVGPAADVYALGAILYEMLTGRPPFAGEAPMDVILQVLENTPAPASQLRAGVPRDLETICQRCLEKEPRDRYARAADLADDLESWLENRPIRARPAGRVERAVKWARRHPLPTALLAVLALSLVAGSAASTWFGLAASRRANEAQIALGQSEQAAKAERWERYLAEIAAAANALQINNTASARRSLEAAPAEYRNWEWRHFHSQLDGARVVLHGLDPDVRAMDLSADGRRLAFVTAEGAIRLWDVAADKDVAVLRAPPERLTWVGFSPDGRRLATGRDRLRLWDAVTGALCWEEPARTGTPAALYYFWSPDGRYVAGTTDGRLRVWDVATGTEILCLVDETIRRPIAFSPDGTHVAHARNDRSDLSVVVREMPTGRVARTLRGHTSYLWSLAYSPDGRRIAGGTFFDDNSLHLWDADTGVELAVGRGHTNSVTHLAFSPDGRHLASASLDQTVRLWDGMTGTPQAALRGHTGIVTDMVFSPDGAHLVSASEDQTLRVWDPASAGLVAVLRGHTDDVRVVRYGAGGALLASASADGTVRLWDADVASRNGVLRRHTNFVYDVAFRPDGGEVVSAAWDGTVRRWDPTTGRETAAPLDHSMPAAPGREPAAPPPQSKPIVSALAYSADGRQLAVVVRGEGVWLWDLASRSRDLLGGRPAHPWRTGDCRPAFHPGGRLLAAGSVEGPVRLWDAPTRSEAGLLTGHTRTCSVVAFRPDGVQLASAGSDGTVRLWDVATRQPTAVLTAPPLYCLAYSADGRLLAAGSTNRSVTVWRVETPEQVGQVPLGGAVCGVAFSPDGTRLACACADNTIRLLDVATLREVTELRGHGAYVHAVQFSPDGTRLASASGDHTVRIWDTLSAQQRADVGSSAAAK